MWWVVGGGGLILDVVFVHATDGKCSKHLQRSNYLKNKFIRMIGNREISMQRNTLKFGFDCPIE